MSDRPDRLRATLACIQNLCITAADTVRPDVHLWNTGTWPRLLLPLNKFMLAVLALAPANALLCTFACIHYSARLKYCRVFQGSSGCLLTSFLAHCS